VQPFISYHANRVKETRTKNKTVRRYRAAGLALVGVWTYMTSKNWPDTSKFRGCTHEYVQIFLSGVSVRRKIMSRRIDARPAWVNDHYRWRTVWPCIPTGLV